MLCSCLRGDEASPPLMRRDSSSLGGYERKGMRLKYDALNDEWC